MGRDLSAPRFPTYTQSLGTQIGPVNDNLPTLSPFPLRTKPFILEHSVSIRDLAGFPSSVDGCGTRVHRCDGPSLRFLARNVSHFGQYHEIPFSLSRLLWRFVSAPRRAEISRAMAPTESCENRRNATRWRAPHSGTRLPAVPSLLGLDRSHHLFPGEA